MKYKRNTHSAFRPVVSGSVYGKKHERTPEAWAMLEKMRARRIRNETLFMLGVLFVSAAVIVILWVW